MFRDDFKKELDDIKVYDNVKSEILEKIEKAKSQKYKSAKKNKKCRYAISAVAALLCIVVATVSVINVFKTPSITDKTLLNTSGVYTAAIDGVSYSAVYDLFKEIYDKQQSDNQKTVFYNLINGFFMLDKSTDAAIEEENDLATGSLNGIADDTVQENSDYSETNTQVKGVDEGDVVKTDGKYIYILKSSTKTVNIVLANEKSPKKVSEINYRDEAEDETVDTYVSEMYIKNNRLILVKQKYVYATENQKSSSKTVTEIYDVSKPENPTLLSYLSQSGDTVSSRLVGEVIYIFSNQNFYSEPTKKDVTSYVPSIEDENGCKAIEEDDICCFIGEIDRSYFVATSVNIKTGERIDEEAVLGGGANVYVNENSIYAAASECTYRYLDSDTSADNKDKTNFLRLKTDNGNMTYFSSGSVNGTILNQFSMDEYNGYFRVVTTVTEYNVSEVKSNTEYTASRSAYIDDVIDESVEVSGVITTNSLYILNQQLEIVGKIEGLAEDERVYSVRFDKDVAYFVTFRQVDPLFTVDMSDPTAPQIMSQLKIPGFSSYLHPYGDGLLLGIGKNADENTGAVGNVKLSMFDVSDPANVSEKNIVSLPAKYTQAEDTHKAVLIDVSKNIIGFAGSDYKTEYYYIYGYEENGFNLKAKLEIKDKTGYDVRGIYIGDYFYLCTQNTVTVYSFDNFNEITKIVF